MTDLSPAAQAVMDATYREMDYAPRGHVQWAAAAALRAVADQVVPANGSRKNNEIRAELLDIAAELKTSTTETDD